MDSIYQATFCRAKSLVLEYLDRYTHRVAINNNRIKSMPYDKDEIAKIMARVVLNREKWKKDREYICSELFYECFLKAEKVFKKDRRGFISPENIWTDEKLSLLGRIL